ncbi:MAG: hypothetical protein P4L22_00345 [Candidatus Babeliales bacterium]|nr:hypothetical protein [Candidatus Babeliales bacterium]
MKKLLVIFIGFNFIFNLPIFCMEQTRVQEFNRVNARNRDLSEQRKLMMILCVLSSLLYNTLEGRELSKLEYSIAVFFVLLALTSQEVKANNKPLQDTLEASFIFAGGIFGLLATYNSFQGK